MPRKTNLPARIVAHLKRCPTASRKELSAALGVSYQAVQKHLRKLEEAGLVQPGFLVDQDWDAGKHELWVFIETRFPPRSGEDRESGGRDYQGELCREIVAKLTENDEYADDISFGSVRILLGGNWDLLLQLYAHDKNAVGRFVTRFLRSQPSVERTSTAWVLDAPRRQNPISPGSARG